MKIGIEATHANKPERSGVEEYCFQIIQNLKKIIPPEVEVVLYSNEPLNGELDELPENWKIKILKWPFHKLWSQLRLSTHFLFNRPDIFFAPGQLVPFFCPKRTIAMIHDSAFLAEPKAYGFLSKVYLKWMNKRILKVASGIITSTEFNKAEIAKFYGAEIAKKVSVVPLAFQIVNPTPSFDPRNLGISKPYLVTVGRLETKKNTLELINAFTELRKGQDLQLVLAGKPGVGFSEIEKTIKKNPYKNDIVRVGYLSRADLVALVQRSEVFVFPSRYEGFGMPVIEAMSLGVPVVASDIPALREVGGEAALYAKVGDAVDLAGKISLLLKDTGEHIKSVELGKEQAAKFSWKKTAESTWNVVGKA